MTEREEPREAFTGPGRRRSLRALAVPTAPPRRRVRFSTLRDALKALGYRMGVTEKFVAFEEEVHDAFLAFPRMQPDDLVNPAYVLMARMNVVGMGIADERAFDAALRRAARRPKTPSGTKMVGASAEDTTS